MNDTPLRDRRLPLVLVLGVAVFVGSWFVIHHLFYALDHLRDTVEYARDAHGILVQGKVPYRDFPFEYPPLALPVFLLPSLIAGRHFTGYQELFELMMAAFGIVILVSVAVTLAAQRIGTRRLLGAVAFVAVAPVLLGAVLLSRYDLLPAALVSAALAAIVLDHRRTGFVLLALGTAAKAYPVVLVPIVAYYVWRRHGARKVVVCVALYFAVLLACFAPFFALAPAGVWAAVHGQASRPPQLESLASAVFLAAHQLAGIHVTLYFTHKSDNIDGHPAMWLAQMMSVTQLFALLFVWISHARGPATVQRLLTASAAAVAAFIVFDRVLSPQYLIWLAGLVAVLPGRRGLIAIWLLAIAMWMTQIWYPLDFKELKALAPIESWAVVGRDLLLLALFGLLALGDVPFARIARLSGAGRGFGSRPLKGPVAP